MVVYVVVTSFLRNVAFLIYALFGEISILEIPVVGNFSLFAGLVLPFLVKSKFFMTFFPSKNVYNPFEEATNLRP